MKNQQNVKSWFSLIFSVNYCIIFLEKRREVKIKNVFEKERADSGSTGENSAVRKMWTEIRG